ncbi:response regulator transcription factor [Mucilaginibacter panaciglaebae]|uniref:Response regulator transcription factor n=1 Tax=Mucilaginibacter panaciglaebae TaxID=502331 RepID=A0ABP7WA36_9SPHI
MINIILAEDHHIVRLGLRHILMQEPEFQIVGEASNGQQVIDLLESNVNADVLLTDISMPQISGLELADIVNTRFPQINTLLLTMQEEEEYMFKAFRLGVKSYMLKSTDADELIFAIKQVARKRRYLCSSVADRLIKRLVLDNMPVSLPSPNIDFSVREIEVLQLIAEGYTNEEIAEKLFTSRRTVEGYRQSLINKTGTRNTATLIRFVMRHRIIE